MVDKIVTDNMTENTNLVAGAAGEVGVQVLRVGLRRLVDHRRNQDWIGFTHGNNCIHPWRDQQSHEKEGTIQPT